MYVHGPMRGQYLDRYRPMRVLETGLVTGGLRLGLRASQAGLQCVLQAAVTHQLCLSQLHPHSPEQLRHYLILITKSLASKLNCTSPDSPDE